MSEKTPEKQAKPQTPDKQEKKTPPAISLSSKGADLTPEFQQLASENPEIMKALRKRGREVQGEIEEERTQAIVKHYKGLKDKFGISIQNPMAGVKSNSVLTYSIGEMIGHSFAELKGLYPDIDDSRLKRAAIMATVGGFAYATKLVTHEYGHARAMEEAGGKSKVVFFPEGRIGGVALYTKYPDLMSVANIIAVTTAGLNQEEEAAKYGRMKDLRTRKEKARDPLAELPHAASRLMNKFATSSYILSGGGGGDIDNYVAGAQLPGWGPILVNSLLMSALSGSTIDNARKVAGYLTNPDEEVKELSLKVGGVEVFLPELSYYMTPAGAFRTAALLADIDNKLIRLEAGTGKVGQSIEFQIYDVKLGRYVSFSPYAAVSKHKKGKNEIYRAETNKDRRGWKVGAEFEVKLADNATLTGETGYGHHDLMTQYVVPTGSRAIMEGMGGDNFYAWLGITIKR
jgi:hypothetical protein